MRSYPPTGDMLRDIYDQASSTSLNPWGISDHDRHTREIQAVRCRSIFAQDHTHQVTKNYLNRRQLGAEAMWDVATETGEIACAVLVPSTKTSDFAHAAQQMAKREGFRPKAMYSDTWPCNADYWSLILGSEVQGRLGLFHFVQRIMRTMRKRHIDYLQAVSQLLDAVYCYNANDYESLLQALKGGSLSGMEYTDLDIAALKSTRVYHQRYSKYLRKEIRPTETLREKLDDWWHRFKCSASPDSRPARGRLDPTTQLSLFTQETKDAMKNCRDKAQYLQDPLPLEEMYYAIKPNPNSAHGLTEYLSRRGESTLESFHLLLAHFGNCGMRSTLADNLNLTGTARYNLAIRQKLRLNERNEPRRSKMPAAWETVVAFFNHSELRWVNDLAVDAGCPPLFEDVERLGEDNGERFFSEYLSWRLNEKPRNDDQHRCLCKGCGVGNNNNPPPQQMNDAASPSRSPISVLGASSISVLGASPSASPASLELQRITEGGSEDTARNNIGATMDYALVTLQPATALVAAPLHVAQQPIIHIQGQPFAFPHASFLPTPQYCCCRFRVWHNKPGRRGRPPHDFHCRGFR